MKTPLKLESIQLLRAIAVILVVYVHIIDSSAFANPQQKQFFHLENWGAIGLDLFFVISGFIMTIITPNYVENKNWKDFLIKRALRIIPIYWLLSAFSFVMSIAKGSTFTFAKIIKTLIFLPVFDSKSFVFPIIPVGWSLSLEMYFYLLIAGLLVFSNKNTYKNLLVILVTFSAIGFFLKPEHALLKFLFSPLLLEFGFGIISGLIFRKVTLHTSTITSQNWRCSAIAATLTGLALMITSLFTGFSDIDDATIVSENATAALIRTVLWGLPCALFLTGVVLLENLLKIKSPQLFVRLGDASYSCYLLHTTILIPVAMKLFKFSGMTNGDLYILFSLVFVLTGSLFLYQFGEKKLNSFIYDNYISRRKTPGLSLTGKSGLLVRKVSFRFRKAPKATDSPLV